MFQDHSTRRANQDMTHRKAKISARLKAKNNLNSSDPVRNPKDSVPLKKARDRVISQQTSRVNRLRLNLMILRKRKKSSMRLHGSTMTEECMMLMPTGGLLVIMSPLFTTV